jgi:hypothetical protein
MFDEPQLRAIALHLKEQVAPRGFALFVFGPDGRSCQYVSNALREDVARTMAEWLVRTERAFGEVPGATEDRHPFQERDCFAQAERLFRLYPGTKMALFLFDFGDAGALAWKSNDRQAAGTIRRWVNRTSPTLLRN